MTCNTSPGLPGTCRSGAVRANTYPFPKGASLNTRFCTPFLRSLMLRTCERTSSARTMKAPMSSPSGKRPSNFSAKTLHRGAKRFPITHGLQVTWTDGLRYWFCFGKMDFKLRRRHHRPCIGPQNPDIWLLFRIRIRLTGNLFCNAL